MDRTGAHLPTPRAVNDRRPVNTQDGDCPGPEASRRIGDVQRVVGQPAQVTSLAALAARRAAHSPRDQRRKRDPVGRNAPGCVLPVKHDGHGVGRRTRALKVTLPFLPRTLMRGLVAYGTARAVCPPFQAVFVQTRRPQEGPAPVRPPLPRLGPASLHQHAPSRSVSGPCVRATTARWQRVTSSAMRFRISPCALLRSARSSWARGRALPQRPFQLTLGPHHLWTSPPCGSWGDRSPRR